MTILNINKVCNTKDIEEYLYNLEKNISKKNMEELLMTIIKPNINKQQLINNRGVWGVMYNNKNHTGLAIGGFGFLIYKFIKTNQKKWLNRILENNEYFSIRHSSIEHGLGGYILAELYLFIIDKKMLISIDY